MAGGELLNFTDSSSVAWTKGAQTGTDPATGLPIFPLTAATSIVGAVGLVIDGGGAVPATGIKGRVQVPFNCTITGWTLLADQSGSAQITVSKSSYSGFPTVASIVASAPPLLSSAQKNTSTTLTGWTTAIAAGDVLSFNLDSAATVTYLSLELQVLRS